MTCVVAITDGRNLVFGADSAAANLKTGEIYNLANEKVFFGGPWLVGYTTSYRLGQILRYRVAWPEPPHDLDNLEGFVAGEVVDAVRKSMREAGFGSRRRGGETAGTFLLGLRGKIFGISDDYSVAHVPMLFAAIGHGRFLAYGALHATRESGLSLEQRCRAALEAAETFDPTVRSPFGFLAA